MKTIYPSGHETALNKDDVTNLERMLQTRFINIASFFEQDDSQRKFKNLIESHSIIKVNHMDGTWMDYANYPLNMFPPLRMIITEDEPNKTIVEYKVGDKDYRVPLIDFPDISVTFADINERLNDSEFMRINSSKGIYDSTTWFMVPTSLELSELCGIIGYSVSKPL